MTRLLPEVRRRNPVGDRFGNGSVVLVFLVSCMTFEHQDQALYDRSSSRRTAHSSVPDTRRCVVRRPAPFPGLRPPLEPVTASSPALHLVEPTPKRQQKPSTLCPTGHAEGEQMLLFA